ncbi:hypothetical protein O1157_14885 [Streptomyces albogriseolus]
MHGEVSTVPGERRVFDEEERSDDGGFPYILMAVLQEGRDGPIEHRPQFRKAATVVPGARKPGQYPSLRATISSEAS